MLVCCCLPYQFRVAQVLALRLLVVPGLCDTGRPPGHPSGPSGAVLRAVRNCHQPALRTSLDAVLFFLRHDFANFFHYNDMVDVHPPGGWGDKRDHRWSQWPPKGPTLSDSLIEQGSRTAGGWSAGVFNFNLLQQPDTMCPFACGVSTRTTCRRAAPPDSRTPKCADPSRSPPTVQRPGLERIIFHNYRSWMHTRPGLGEGSESSPKTDPFGPDGSRGFTGATYWDTQRGAEEQPEAVLHVLSGWIHLSISKRHPRVHQSPNQCWQEMNSSHNPS